MNIGISAPISIASLQHHLDDLSQEDLKLGLGGTAVNEIIIGLIKAGHHVTVFTLDGNTKIPKILNGPNLKIIIGHFRMKSRIKYIDFCRYEYLQIKRFIKQELSNIDIVHAHWSYEFAIGTLLAKAPHLITFRDYAPKILMYHKHVYRFFRLLMDWWVRKNGENFSYNSQYLQQLIAIEGNVVPNSFREEAILSPKDIGKELVKICCLANGWGSRKNTEAALKAFSVLKESHNNVELHLFGSGYEENTQKYHQMGAMGLNTSVKYRGHYPHISLMEELEKFDIMLHPSREESFGNNLLEAMAKGIPVVAGKNSGAVPWVLGYGQAGILVDVEDPIDIANGVASLIDTPTLYKQYSEAGIANLKKRFTQKIVCEQYIALYTAIVAKINNEKGSTHI